MSLTGNLLVVLLIVLTVAAFTGVVLLWSGSACSAAPS